MYLTLLFWSKAHDIHVSQTKFNVGKQTITVETKIFYDDLQMAMNLVPGEELPEEYTNADSLIFSFIKKNLIVKINDKEVIWEYHDSFAADQAVWTNITLRTDENSVEKVSVFNKILTDLYADQRNIMSIRSDNNIQRYLLDGKKNDVEYTLP